MDAVYYSDYKLTPIFTSQAVSTNIVTAYVSSNFAKASLSIVQSSAAPVAIADLTAMSTNIGGSAISGYQRGERHCSHPAIWEVCLVHKSAICVLLFRVDTGWQKSSPIVLMKVRDRAEDHRGRGAGPP
jgi:hypothetical protein